MSGLTFEPLASLALWLTLAVLSAVAIVLHAMRRPMAVPRQRWIAILALMSAGLCSVLIVLLNPTWIEPVSPPAGKPQLTVLVDASGSMAVADGRAGRTRYREAAEVAARLADDTSSQFEVRVRTFASETSSVEAADLEKLAPQGTATNLGRAIAESLEADRPQGAAVVVLSDGIHNSPGGIESLLEVAHTAKSLNVPIWSSVFGGATSRADVEIETRRPQELAFVRQPIPLTVTVAQRGALTSSVTLVLSEQQKEIGRKDVAIGADGTASASFDVRKDVSGLYRYEVKMLPVAGEATVVNNNAISLVRVVDKPIRILLLEGKPYWDAKFLMKTLAADASFEVDAIVKLANGRFLRRSMRLSDGASVVSSTPPSGANPDSKAAAPPPATASGEKGSNVGRSESTTVLTDPQKVFGSAELLDGYQVIVLGRDADVFLSDDTFDQIRRWIARSGGSLVCFRGTPAAEVSQQLSRLLPVRWSPSRETRFRMRMNERGQSLQWLSGQASDEGLSNMPSLAVNATASQPKPLAIVLASAESEDSPPTVTYNSYGSGRTVVVEGAGMWRWAFLAPQFRGHEDVYGALWQNLLRWLVSGAGLAPGQDALLRLDKIRYTIDEPVTPILLVREDVGKQSAITIELRKDGEPSARRVSPIPLGDEPGVYRVPFGKLEPGSYRASLVRGEGGAVTESAAFDVRPFLGEELDVAARPDILTRISQDSGGERLEAIDSENLPALFTEYMQRSRPPRVQRTTAWDRWWVLAGIVAIWAATWTLRRRSGIV